MSDFNTILEQLQSWSLFDLDRLYSAVRHLLNDPAKQETIKRHLKIGMTITYLDYDSNRLVEATILDIKKTRAGVMNLNDKKKWNIPFCCINLEDVDLSPRPKKRGIGLDRSAFSVGETVGWSSSQSGHDLYGVIKKLNPKKALVQLGNGDLWTVRYAYLFPVMDGVIGEETKHIPFIYENIP